MSESKADLYRRFAGDLRRELPNVSDHAKAKQTLENLALEFELMAETEEEREGLNNAEKIDAS